MAQTAPSSPLSTRRILLALLLVAAILPCVALPRFLRAKQSTEWPKVMGVITVSRFEPTSYHQRKTFRGDIRYRYSVGAAEYSSSRISFHRVNAGERNGWQGLTASYPVRKSVDVFYDPKEPSFSVLEPGLTGDMNLLYQADVFFIAAFAAAFLTALYKFREPTIR